MSYVIIHRYTVTKKAVGQGQNVNFLNFFWYFWNYYIKINGKMPRERGKARYDSEGGFIMWSLGTYRHLTYHEIWYLCHPYGFFPLPGHFPIHFDVIIPKISKEVNKVNILSLPNSLLCYSIALYNNIWQLIFNHQRNPLILILWTFSPLRII